MDSTQSGGSPGSGGGDDAPTQSDPTLVEGSGRKGKADAPLTRGTLVGRYVVLDLLGAGGMGVVYAAFDPQLARRVALKVLAPSGRSSHGVARMLREAQALARLSHPNVVAIYDVGATTGNDQVFIAMEHVEGCTLDAWLASTHTWQEIVQMFIAAGHGLAAAHAAGVVHRDFKPANVLVGSDGRVRVMDFGLAREGRESVERKPAPLGAERGSALSDQLTVAGTVMGTPRYMPPEAHRGEHTTEAGDQFSFCVALFEALYGELPFPKEPGPDDDRHWIVQPLPNKPVPRRIGELVVRGLAREPAQRHRSMNELVDALGRNPARTWRRVVVAAIVALAVAGGLGARWFVHARAIARCEDEGDRIDLAWNATRAQQLGAAFAATGLANAPATWQRARAALDTYATSWRAGRTEACKSELDGSLRTVNARAARACFDEQWWGLHALVDELAKPDPVMIQKAATASMSLPQARACLDEARLRHDVEPPPAVRQELPAIRESLSRAGAALATGHYDRSLEHARTALAAATRVHWAPLATQAALAIGTAQDELGRYADARHSLEDAYVEATAEGRDDVALSAASRLAFALGGHLDKYEEGMLWGRFAQSLVNRLGQGSELVAAEVLSNLDYVEFEHGDYAKSVELQERALAIRERILGPDHPLVANSLNSLGLAKKELGKYDEAISLLQRAAAIWEKALGAEHPSVATALNNLGEAYGVHGETDKALASSQRALAIWEKTLGPDHPNVATALLDIGASYRHREELDKAFPLYERALKIREKALGPEHPAVAWLLRNMGRVRLEGHHYPEARALLERALAIQEKSLGPNHPDVAASLIDLGDIASALHERDKAAPLYERALAIQEKAGPDHPNLGVPLLALAHVRLDQGNKTQAISLAERALAVRERGGARTELIAQARFELADILWKAGGDHKRAIALATTARELVMSLGDHDSIAEADKWLAEHHE